MRGKYAVKRNSGRRPQRQIVNYYTIDKSVDGQKARQIMDARMTKHNYYNDDTMNFEALTKDVSRFNTDLTLRLPDCFMEELCVVSNSSRIFPFNNGYLAERYGFDVDRVFNFNGKYFIVSFKNADAYKYTSDKESYVDFVNECISGSDKIIRVLCRWNKLVDNKPQLPFKYAYADVFFYDKSGNACILINEHGEKMSDIFSVAEQCNIVSEILTREEEEFQLIPYEEWIDSGMCARYEELKRECEALEKSIKEKGENE